MTDLAIIGKSINSKNLKRGNMFYYSFKDDSFGVGKKEYIVHISDGAGYVKYISAEKFNEHFIRIFNSFSIEHNYTKKKFIFYTKQRFYVSFWVDNLSIKAIKQLYVDIFYYLEQIQRKTPEVLLSFEYTIQDTFHKLEKASKLLDEKDFIKSVTSARPVFEEMYKTSLSLCKDDTGATEALVNEKKKVVKTFLEEFKKEMHIKSEVLKDLNNSSKVLDSLNKLK